MFAKSLNIDLIVINNKHMSEEIIDFGSFSKQVKINPAVPLQILDAFCRNGSRIQATLLGKVYSSTIEVLEAVPISVAEENQIVKLDFIQHAKSLENIMNVYSRIQILGVAVTNLTPDNRLAELQTMYSNKESGFKAQGILSFPLIVSISTKINANSQNIEIRSFTFNKTYKYCKQLMNVVAFEQISTEISMGDADVQSMTPLFTALNDQEEVIPDRHSLEMIKQLSKNLKDLKKYGNLSMEQEIKVRRVLDKLSTEQEFEMNELAYLLDYASLQRRLSIKLNKFQKQ